MHSIEAIRLFIDEHSRVLLIAGFLLSYLVAASIFLEMVRNRYLLKKRLGNIELSQKYLGDQEEQLAKPLSERLIKPLADNLASYISKLLPLNAKSRTEMEGTLRSAGIKMTPVEYLASQGVIMILLCVLCGMYFSFVGKLSFGKVLTYMLFVVFAYYTVARFMLMSKVTERTDKLENNMPDVMDLLTVCVSAGLSFDQALSYIVENSTGVFVDELTITQREMFYGRPRAQALSDLAKRCNVDSLKSFVSAVTQADTLGIPIANILKTEADNIRMQHKQKIEEKAAKLPVKILIPMVVFIFPVMFIIILGPAVPNILSIF